MPFQSKYTDQQRAAIIAAVLDEGFTVPRAVNAAELGDLGPAFKITASAAYNIIAKERRSRYLDLPIAEMGDDVYRRVLELASRDLERLERMPKLGPAETRALRDLWKIARMAKADTPRLRQAPGRPSGPSMPPSLAERIVAQERSQHSSHAPSNGHTAA